MPKVNPIYANPKVLGSPVKILEIRTDKDNPLGYLDRGRLNNGITELKDYLEKLSPVRRRKVMGHINKFAGTLPILFAAREVLNNGEK